MLLLALLVATVSTSAAVLLYARDAHTFLYFGDATSHIVKARQFFDSQDAWYHHLGTVWLPLSHILLIPFVAFDALFFTGIAGPMLGIPCLVGTAMLLFSIVDRTAHSTAAAFLSAALFALNPNVVYMAMTPMNEPSLIFLVTLGGYALLRSLERGSLGWLLLSSVAVMFASLSRYEAWGLIPYLAFAAVLWGIEKRRESKGAALFGVLAVGAISGAGVLFWLLWNRFEYGNPLEFAQGTYSVIPDAYRESRQHFPPFLMLTVCRAILTIFGPFALFVAYKGIVSLRRIPENKTVSLLLGYFLMPVLFVLVSVLAGYIGIDEWWWNWRYVLTLGLFLSVAVGIGLSGWLATHVPRRARWIFIAGLVAMPIAQLTIPAVGVATYRDAAKCMTGPTPSAIAVGERLREAYRGGPILLIAGEGEAHRIMLSSDLPARRFNIVPHPDETPGPADFFASARFIAIGKQDAPQSAPACPYWLAWEDRLSGSYTISQEDRYYILLERSE